MVEQTRSMGWWPSLYEPFHNLGQAVHDWFSPPSEAAHDEDAYTVKVELPGVKLEDVELSVRDGVVTVKGEKRSERQEKTDTYFFSERRYGSFSRSFRMPNDADGEKISADLKDGVLTITAPKVKAAEKPQTSIRITRS